MQAMAESHATVLARRDASDILRNRRAMRACDGRALASTRILRRTASKARAASLSHALQDLTTTSSAHSIEETEKVVSWYPRQVARW